VMTASRHLAGKTCFHRATARTNKTCASSQNFCTEYMTNVDERGTTFSHAAQVLVPKTPVLASRQYRTESTCCRQARPVSSRPLSRPRRRESDCGENDRVSRRPSRFAVFLGHFTRFHGTTRTGLISRDASLSEAGNRHVFVAAMDSAAGGSALLGRSAPY